MCRRGWQMIPTMGRFDERTTMNLTTPYKTAPSRAWRNLMVATINTAIERRLIGLREGEDYWPGKKKDRHEEHWASSGIIVDFDLDGMPAAAHLDDAGCGEISIHCALYPKKDHAFIRAGNAGFSAGDAFAYGLLERREGAWLQRSGGTAALTCRRELIEKVAAMDIAPLGYADHGRLMM